MIDLEQEPVDWEHAEKGKSKPLAETIHPRNEKTPRALTLGVLTDEDGPTGGKTSAGLAVNTCPILRHRFDRVSDDRLPVRSSLVETEPIRRIGPT